MSLYVNIPFILNPIINKMSKFCKNFETSFSHKLVNYLTSTQRLESTPVSFIVTIREPGKSNFEGPFVFKENIHKKTLEYPLWSHDFSFISAMGIAVYKNYQKLCAALEATF